MWFSWMGCGASRSSGVGKSVQDLRRTVQPKAPILLFCLPGPGRDAMFRTLQSDLMSPERNGGESVNVRFIEVVNLRFNRPNWIKDLEVRKDYAGIFYLADVRDHPTLLLTARTMNWFLQGCSERFDVKVIVLYDDPKQLEEFQTFTPGATELFCLSETDQESIIAYMQLLRAIEKHFFETRVNQTVTRVSL
jgi:hypothetical protein